MEVDDEPRWLLALISDTGMRLSEAAGLAVEDIVLDAEIPYVHVRPHPWRSLKTASSERKVPLVGASLWAAKRAVEACGVAYAFPSICDGQRTMGNSTSARLNKWMKSRVSGSGKVIHSLRHSMRDRLRAVECPSEVIDQIGGWTSSGVGQSYGSGYPDHVLSRWLERIEL
jgi:integrase